MLLGGCIWLKWLTQLMVAEAVGALTLFALAANSEHFTRWRSTANAMPHNLVAGNMKGENHADIISEYCSCNAVFCGIALACRLLHFAALAYHCGVCLGGLHTLCTRHTKPTAYLSCVGAAILCVAHWRLLSAFVVRYQSQCVWLRSECPREHGTISIAVALVITPKATVMVSRTCHVLPSAPQ